MPCRALTARRFAAADFSSILDKRTVTAVTYSGVPLAELSSTPRGKTLTWLARQIDAKRHPGAQIEDAVAGVRVNGAKRGQSSTPYDWQRDGKRIACKSAQLNWDQTSRRWRLQFSNVKLAFGDAPAAFDELLLAAYTPRGVYLYRHDLRLGVSTRGKSTAATGHYIKLYGPQHEEDCDAARSAGGWRTPDLAVSLARASSTCFFAASSPSLLGP